MYLLVDFSNAARKAFTQIKKAKLLGGMGTSITRKIPDNHILKDLLDNKRVDKSILKKPNSKEQFDQFKDMMIENVAKINAHRKEANKDVRSYTDAAQIARRGKTKPIKANTYVAREGYIQHPQDNTVLSGAINKIDKQTRATGNEHGTYLYKEKDKLKVVPISKGSKGQIYITPPPIGKERLIDIHSHPLKTKTAPILEKISNVVPSPQDLSRTRSKTSLIVSPQQDNKRTITKYIQTGGTKPDEYYGLSGWRKRVRREGGDYTVITKGKNQ